MLELKEPGQGEILLKVLASGVCHTDVNVQDGTLGNSLSVVGSYHIWGRALKGYSPMVPGHEFVGDVVAVGPEEQVWKVGDRAGGGWHGGHDRMTITNASEPVDYRSPEQP